MKFKKLFNKSNRRKPRANAFVLESLEPRLLLSATPMTAAVVTTDHLDYAPGETAVITTSNTNGDGLQFGAGELVRFQVSRTDGIADHVGSTADMGPAGNEAWYVTDGVGGFTAHLGSDVSGDGVADWIAPDNDRMVNSSISTTWFVEEQYRNSSLLVTAAGQESGAVATQAFTDAGTNTTTVVTATAATTVYGTNVNFTATVTAAAGTVDPTGSVEFFVDGVSLGVETATSGGGADGVVQFKTNLFTFTLTAGIHSVHAVFTGTAGSFNDSTSANISHEVTQKHITGRFTANNKVYDGTTLAPGTATANNVELIDLGNVALDGTGNFDNANVGINKAVTFTIIGTGLTGSAAGNYILDSVTNDQADITPATVVVSDYTGVYDGLDHGATIVGAPGEDLSGSLIMTRHTNVGSYTESWTFANPNYNPASGTNNITITKANATIVTNGYSGVYDGATHTATATATGALGESLGGLILSATAHTNAGIYSDGWTFTDSTGNYNSTSGSVISSIAKAVASINVSGYTGIYDAAAHGASGTVTGVDALGAALGSSLTLGASFTNAPGGTANWLFSGGTNYTDQNGSVAIVINKAVATINVLGYTGSYDAAAHGATIGGVTGVAGDLAASGSVLTLGGESFIDAPGGTAHWSFSGGTNYTDQNGSVAIVINKAVATINVLGYTGSYDAAAHGATIGGVTGVAGDLAASGSVLTLGGESFIDAPGGTAHWLFSGGTNYTDQNGSVAIVINKAVATINVLGYTGSYDAAAHGATIGGVTGVAGDLAASGSVLTLGGESFIDAPGGTAHWSFSGGTNYTDQNGSVAIVIAKATATITGNGLNGSGYFGTYDGQVHAATATVTGVGGVILGQVVSNTTHTSAGIYSDTVTYIDGTGNYKDTSKVVKSYILKASVTITGDGLNGSGYFGTYDGQAHAATATVTGVGGVILGQVVSNTTHTSAGIYSDTVTYIDGTGNYKDTSKVVKSYILKASVTITGDGLNGSGYFGTYDGQAHAATATVTGVGGVILGQVVSNTTHTSAGIYSDTVTYIDGTGNYKDTSKVVKSYILKASVTITGDGLNGSGYFGTYDGQAHAATATVTGVGGVILGQVVSNTTHTSAGIYSDTVTYIDGTGNYKDTSKVVKSYILKASVTITGDGLNGSGYFGTYDGQAHAATATVTGVGGVILGSLVSGTTHTNVGIYSDTVTFLGDANYKATSKVLKSYIIA